MLCEEFTFTPILNIMQITFVMLKVGSHIGKDIITMVFEDVRL